MKCCFTPLGTPANMGIANLFGGGAFRFRDIHRVLRFYLVTHAQPHPSSSSPCFYVRPCLIPIPSHVSSSYPHLITILIHTHIDNISELNKQLNNNNMNTIKSIFQWFFVTIGATSAAAVLMAICMAVL